MKVWISGYDYPGFVQGFRSLGWEVFAGPERNWSAWCWGNIASTPAAEPHAFGEFMLAEVKRLGIDLVLISKGFDSNKPAATDPAFWHVPARYLTACREAGAVVVTLDLDSPDSLGFSLMTKIPNVSDAYGTCCVGTREPYRLHGVEHTFEFWPAWDSVQRVLTGPEAERSVDFAFVGSPYLEPNAEFGLPRRDVVLGALAEGATVDLYGSPDWLLSERGGDPALGSVYRGPIPFDRMHEVFARARVGYSSFLRRGFRYLNDRVPVVAGAGAFLLMEEQLGLDGEFPEGVMVGYHRHRDLASFKSRLRYWLDHEAERVAVAGRLQRHVLGQHTYQDRTKRVVAEFEAARVRARSAKRGCCGGG